MPSSSPFSAVNRFGLGARPGEVAEVGSDPRGWLLAQLRPAPAPEGHDGLPSSLALLRLRAELLQGALQARQRDAAPRGPAAQGGTMSDKPARASAAQRSAASVRAMPEDRRAAARTLLREGVREIGLRYAHAASTALPFQERLVRFWSNHFAVSADKNAARSQAAPMEREAIRPHVLGNFADLLLAVETHPAMLLYLDNVASVGEGSRLADAAERRAARRARTAAANAVDESAAMADGAPPRRPVRVPGLNENLAREILELHTLGVDGGYRQDDVRELAKAISGWGTPGPRQLPVAESPFLFRALAHEPGARTVLGRCYAEDGIEQGRAILRDLALHPSTARHLSLKLARHFVADAPPAALVERMAAAYLRSGGELPALYRAMVSDDAAWSPQARKFRTPDDFVVAAMRAGDLALADDPRGLMRLLDGLGQPVFTPRSPAGFPDTTPDWATGDALRKRVQAASALAARVRSPLPPGELARRVVGPEAVDGELGALLRRAGSPQEACALLFASPAFQWRT